MTKPFRIRQLGRHGLVYGIGMMLNKVVAFIMLPIYTRFLTPSDYGLLQLVDMALEVLSIAAGSRLAAGIFHFYHKEDKEQARVAVLSTSMIIMGLTYLVVASVAFFFAPQISQLVLGGAEYAILVQLATARLAFESLIIVPMAYLQLGDKSVRYSLVNAVRMMLQLGLNILFVVFMGLGAEGVLLSGLIGTTTVGMILGVMFFREVGWHPSGRAAGDLFRFGLPFLHMSQCSSPRSAIAIFLEKPLIRLLSDYTGWPISLDSCYSRRRISRSTLLGNRVGLP